MLDLAFWWNSLGSDMWVSVSKQKRNQISHVPRYVSPVHIHSLMNKTSYYLKTGKRSTNYVYIGSHAYLGQRSQEHPVLESELTTSHKDLIYMSWNRNGIRSRGASIPHLWHPDPAGTETSLRRIYVDQKYPHVYTLSIGTGKNQNTKAQW